jgi:hypothetical protein
VVAGTRGGVLVTSITGGLEAFIAIEAAPAPLQGAVVWAWELRCAVSGKARVNGTVFLDALDLEWGREFQRIWIWLDCM